MNREYYATTKRYIRNGPMPRTTRERIEIVVEVSKLFKVKKLLITEPESVMFVWHSLDLE